ncbi:L-lactate dehydrogenase [Candidatus Woesearchaeota archaeon]|nr:L-lactate dehydrogenase [Candidatus Woesearchaeota archaeon]
MSKIAIVGAGFVGSTAAYSLLLHGLAEEIALVDIHREKAHGEAMDLEHGMQFVPNCKISFSNKYDVCAGADIIIVCAGAHQKPGETRLDLVQKNAAIFKEMIPNIVKHNKECIFLIVSNPVDILTYLTLKYSKFPANRVIGSGTTLDTSRFRYLLGKHFKVNPSSVHAYILGEHGDSEFPVWSTANIAGIHLSRLKGYNTKSMKDIYNRTKKAAYEVIAKKGATYYAIGLGITKIVDAILSDQNTVLPVSNLLKNYNGASNVCLSVPCVLGKSGVKKQLVMPFDKKEKACLNKSADILKRYIEKVK